MYLLITEFLVFVVIIPSFAYNNPCEGKIFLDKYYEEQILFGGLHKPINLQMHEYSNSLFFSHTIRRGTHLDFSIRVCHITKMECKDIKEVVGGRAIAYDRKNNEIYLGGRTGIYIYNFTTNTAKFFAEKNKSIWNLFIKNHLFYIDGNTRKLYVFDNKAFKLVPEVLNIEIENYFVSKRFFMYYSNKTALYTAHRPVKSGKVLDKKIHVRQIAQDYATDSVFFAASEGIYYVDDDDRYNVRPAAEINDVFGITFKKTSDSEFEPGLLIFSNKNSIMMLVPGIYADQCLEIKSKKSMFYMRDKVRFPTPKSQHQW